MITIEHIYTAATAGMFLAAGFLVANLLIAAGRVLRGKDAVSELPTRLVGVSIALALAFTAWPYIRTSILDTIGQDAPSVVKTLNGLSSMGDHIPTGANVGLGLDTDDFSGKSLGDIGTAIKEVISAPAHEPWAESETTAYADGATPSTYRVPDVPLVLSPAARDTYVPEKKIWHAPMALPTAAPTVKPTPYVPLVIAPEHMESYKAAQEWHAPMALPQTESAAQGCLPPLVCAADGGGPTNPPVKPAQTAPGTTATTYTIRRGDTMFKIALARYGDGNQWPRICNANVLEDCSNLVVGRTIVLP